MAEIYLQTEYTLTPEGIDAAGEDIHRAGEQAKVSKRHLVQLQYFVEELLLNIQSAIGPEEKISVELKNDALRPTLFISFPGERYNPIADKNEPDSYISTMLGNAYISYSYTYEQGENRVSIRIPVKGPNEFIRAAVAFLLALLAAWLLKPLPQNVKQAICDEILTPIGNAYLATAGTAGILMIFFSLVTRISHMRSTRQLERKGAVTVRHAVRKNLLAVLLIGLTVPFILRIISSDADFAGAGWGDLFKLVIGVVPGNIVEPFVNKNAMQVCFVAALLGVFTLRLKEKTRTLSKCFDDLNNIAMPFAKAMRTIVSGYIFVAILGIFLSGKQAELKECWRVFVLLIFYAVIYTLITKLITKFVCKIPLHENFKNSFKIGLMGFAACSSMTCFALNKELAINKYGADPENVNFSMLLQQIIYKVDMIGSLSIWALFMVKFYGMKLTLSGLVVILLMTTIMSVASPPVPGGLIAASTALFGCMGFPEEALELFVSTIVFSDMLLTGMKTMCGADELVIVDKKLRVRS